jgi:RNA recognition motif-containing protein
MDRAAGEWLEFLITPPSWERPLGDALSVSHFEDCLPADLLDDHRISPPPSLDNGTSDAFTLHLQPSTFRADDLEDDSDPPGEMESRAISLSNLDPQTDVAELFEVMSGFGEIHSVDLAQAQFGLAVVRYFDIRAAHTARRHRVHMRGRLLLAVFGPPFPIVSPRKPPNNGTIVIFHLRSGVSNDAISAEFSQFGGIRQIRSAPGKLTQRFIEFFDLRAAQAAVKATRGKKMFNSKISVEFSLPGGFRRATDKGPKLPTVERPPRLAPCTICH